MGRKSKKERQEKRRRRRRQRRGLDPWAVLTPDNWRARLVASYDYSPTFAAHMERWLADHRGEVGLDWARNVTRLQHYNDHLKPGGGALYDEHLSGAPSSAGAEWDAGMCHFNVSGDLLAARRHLGAAATLAPEVLTVHYHLGLIYHLLGAAERAEQSYRAAIAATTDGFKIAEHDLAIRGMGDFFGTRQHGLAPLRVARILEDMALLKMAGRDAAAIVDSDPNLMGSTHQLLRKVLVQQYGDTLGLIDVG